MTAHRIPFVFPLPDYLERRRLSSVRSWATGQVLRHAKRTGSVMVGQPYGWQYDAVDEDGQPAVACVAVLAPLPTLADAVAALRARPTKAAEQHRCLLCQEIDRLRRVDYTDTDIAARLEMTGARAVAKHWNHHNGRTP